MAWRLRYHSVGMRKNDAVFFKLQMNYQRTKVKAQYDKLSEHPDIVIQDYQNVGMEVVQRIFPLLDPRLDFEQAKKAHCISQILNTASK